MKAVAIGAFASAVFLVPVLEAQSPSPTDTLRLTLSDARALALRANRDLRAARVDTAIARGELLQASVFFRSNPTVDVLAGGPGPEIGLGQEIEIAGQRAARRFAAIAGFQRAEAGILDTTRLTLASVDRFFFRLAVASQRANLAEQGRLLNERLAEAAGRQLDAGKISRLESNLAVVELGRARARSLLFQREREEFASALRELLGLPPRQPIAPVVDLVGPSSDDLSPLQPGGVDTAQRSFPSSGGANKFAVASPAAMPDSLDADSLTSVALSRRPDLRERAAAARQARGLASTARREALPNLSVRASSEPRDAAGGRVIRPGVGISLPIFNRNRGEVQARLAEARQAELQGAALIASIRLEVARSLASYRSARAETRLFEQTVLQPARENRRLLELAYASGKVGLPLVLLIRNQVIDAELEYLNAWLAEREALTDLSASTGDALAAVGEAESRRNR